MDFNTTGLNFSAFTTVLAGGGTILGIGAVMVALIAVVYALCFRRGRITFSRAGLTIEASPQPRAPSESLGSAPPPLRVENLPPTTAVPRRNSIKRKATTEVPSDAVSAEVAVPAPTASSSTL
jgi:hypothetical protein